tara:strand:- start:6581 stop:7834 length:1254 start_codon:yes stop_codon:yes gene_type:complete
MFSFLKNLFRKARTPEDMGIEQNKLLPWFEAECKKAIKDANKSVEPVLEQLKAKINETEENIEKLNNAELPNPNISMKEKQFMEGNRSAYTKAVKNFLNEMLLVDDIKHLQEHYKGFDAKLNSFAKSSGRSYYILQEFLGQESSLIANNINSISKLVSQIKELGSQKDIISLDSIRNLINYLNNKENTKKRLDEELKKNLAAKEETEKRLSLLKEDINKIENSDDKRELIKLINDKDNIINKIKELEREYLQDFSNLKKPFSKYIRITLSDVKLLDKYIINPLEALKLDKELKIMEILNNMANSIRKNQISLDSKKKLKVLSVIKKLDKEYFDNFFLEKNNLNERLEKIKQDINENNAYKKQALLNKEQKEAMLKLDKVKKDINHIKEETGKIDIQRIKDELEAKIFRVLQVRVKIQ